MQQSPISEAYSLSTVQEIFHLLQKAKWRHVYNRMPLALILRQVNPVCIFASHFLWSTLILCPHLCQVVSSFPVFKLKYCMFASPPLYITYVLIFFNETELESVIPYQHTCSSVERNSWHHHRWWRHHPWHHNWCWWCHVSNRCKTKCSCLILRWLENKNILKLTFFKE